MALIILESDTCPSCETPFKGSYCYQCGEKKIVKKELSIRYFLAGIWSAITFSDVKFVRSLQYLLFSPGFLTIEFFKGKRNVYAKPLALFFAINLAYFIYQPIDALNSELYSQMNGQMYSNWASDVVNNHLTTKNLKLREFFNDYNQTSENVSKLFLFVLVIVFSGFYYLINLDKVKTFYVQLITATHFISFTILGFLFILPLLGHLGILIYLFTTHQSELNFNPNANSIILPVVIILGIYTYLMIRRLYQQNVLITSVKTLLTIFAFAGSILLYRLFLFITTMALV